MGAVTIEGLSKSFGETVVLPSFDLAMEDGEFVVLLGPSGCGKTTVLRCLAGLDRPDAGRIQIDGHVIEDSARRISIPTQKRELGLVFQNYALWPHMNVWDNIAYPLRVRRTNRQQIDRKLHDILSLVGLEKHAKRWPSELSGGQQQRVALARALVASPRLLLLDEPLSNLDAQRRASLRKRLRNIHREIRTSTVYVTHDQVEALTMADRVLVMRGGRIEQSGAPRDVFEHPVNRFVADFLGYENILSGNVISANGRFATIYSELWDGELQVESPIRLLAGTAVELAFRANNVTVHLATRDTKVQVNTKLMEIRDAIFLGDTVEYTLGTGRHQVVARLPIKNAATYGPAGTSRFVSVAPQDVAILMPDFTIAQAPVAELMRLKA